MMELRSTMLGQLIPCGGGDAIPLTGPKLLVGRRSSCDIKLDFQNVSSHHCEFELKEGYWHIRDLGSSNGIKVNGVDMMKWNAVGQIVDFKVMLRPLKAVNLIHQKMAAMLEVFAKGATG